ncbi:MAG: BatD family protein [Candidatus Aminicenantes bacterium]|nr:BatD family protein [Candidatus Aminicenantes bacterium]
MKALRLFCILLAAVAARPLDAAQVTLTASTLTATVGEQVELRLIARSLEAVDEMRVSLPAGDFEVLRRQSQPMIRTTDWRTFEHVLTIAFFKTGEFAVGPVTIELLAAKTVIEKEQSNAVTIKVRSLLGADDRDIKPLKKPLTIPGNPLHLLKYAAGAGLILLLAVGLLLLRRKWRKKSLGGEIVLPEPEIELEQRVNELWQRRLTQKGEHKLFFIRLGEIIKGFLNRAYVFNADDLTSTEVMARLGGGEKDVDLVACFKTIFTRADLVKFAEQVPGTSAIDSLAQSIAIMIEKYKKRRSLANEANRVQTGR